jgi:hypothetical protein
VQDAAVQDAAVQDAEDTAAEEALDCVPLTLEMWQAMYGRAANRPAVLDGPPASGGVAERDWPGLMERLGAAPERIADRDALVAAMAAAPGSSAVVRVSRPSRREHVYLLVRDDRDRGQVTVAVVDAQEEGAAGLNGGRARPVHEMWPSDTQVALFDGAGKPVTLAELAPARPGGIRSDTALVDPSTGRPGAGGIEVEDRGSKLQPTQEHRRWGNDVLAEWPPQDTVGGEPASVLKIVPDLGGRSAYLAEMVVNPIQMFADEHGWHDKETAFEALGTAIARLRGASEQEPGTRLSELLVPEVVKEDALVQRMGDRPGQPDNLYVQITAGVPLQGLLKFQRWLLQAPRPVSGARPAQGLWHLRDGLDFGVMGARMAREQGLLGAGTAGELGDRYETLAGYLTLLYTHAAGQVNYHGPREMREMNKNSVHAISRDDWVGTDEWPGLRRKLPGAVQEHLERAAPQIKELFASMYAERNPQRVDQLRERSGTQTFDVLTSRPEELSYTVGGYMDRALLPGEHEDINPYEAYSVRTWFPGPDANAGRGAKMPLVRLELRYFGHYLTTEVAAIRADYDLIEAKLTEIYQQLVSPTPTPGPDPLDLPPASPPAPLRTTGPGLMPASQRHEYLAGFDLNRAGGGAAPAAAATSQPRPERGLLHIPMFDRLEPREIAAAEALVAKAGRQGVDVVVWLNKASDPAERGRRFGEDQPDPAWTAKVQAWARARQVTVAGFWDVFGPDAPPERLAEVIAAEYFQPRLPAHPLLPAAEIAYRFGGVVVRPGAQATGELSRILAAAAAAGDGLVLADAGGGEPSADVMGAVAGSAGAGALLDELHRIFTAPHLGPDEVTRIITATSAGGPVPLALLGKGSIGPVLDGVARRLRGPEAGGRDLPVIDFPGEDEPSSPAPESESEPEPERDIPVQVAEPGGPVARPVPPAGVAAGLRDGYRVQDAPGHGAWLADRDVSELDEETAGWAGQPRPGALHIGTPASQADLRRLSPLVSSRGETSARPVLSLDDVAEYLRKVPAGSQPSEVVVHRFVDGQAWADRLGIEVRALQLTHPTSHGHEPLVSGFIFAPARPGGPVLAPRPVSGALEKLVRDGVLGPTRPGPPVYLLPERDGAPAHTVEVVAPDKLIIRPLPYRHDAAWEDAADAQPWPGRYLTVIDSRADWSQVDRVLAGLPGGALQVVKRRLHVPSREQQGGRSARRLAGWWRAATVARERERGSGTSSDPALTSAPLALEGFQAMYGRGTGPCWCRRWTALLSGSLTGPRWRRRCWRCPARWRSRGSPGRAAARPCTCW